MVKIGVVGLFHETNSFGPGKTEEADFRQQWAEGRDPFYALYEHTRTSMGGAIDEARNRGAELVPGFYAGATPGSIVSAAAAESLISRVVASIPVEIDGLLVILHGAMVSEQFPDVEGELLSRIRHKVGEKLPIAATLDMHANGTERMIAMAHMFVGFDTYPHVDIYERAREAFALLVRHIDGKISPTAAFAQTGMMLVPQAMMTSEGAMKQLMDRAFEMERMLAVLNVTVLGGFPYSDIPDACMSFIVTTDGDALLASRLADELVGMAKERKDRFRVSGLSPEQAVAKAAAIPDGPVILIEGADNVGGGAPGDATHLLPVLLKKTDKTSFITIWDEQAAREAARLGEGGEFRGFVGARSHDLSGKPVYIEGVVRRVTDGKFTYTGTFANGHRENMGHTAVVQCGSVTVMLTEHRVRVRDIGYATSVGLDPASFDMIVVKAAVAWKTAFGHIARDEIQVDSPGCCSFNLHHFNYKQAKGEIV